MGKRRNAPKSRSFDIQPGMCGFFVTCFRDQEARCTSEILQLLDRVSEHDTDEPTVDEAAHDFANSIASEVAHLRAKTSRKYQAQAVGGLSCIVFIKTTEDPLPLAQQLFALDARGNALHAARFCQRILPISVICPATLEDVKKEATHLIAIHLQEPRKYCVVFESRFNQSIDRRMLIDLLADTVGPKHKVSLDNPELVIMVQLFMNLCGISVLPRYQECKKYNIQEFYKAHRAP